MNMVIQRFQTRSSDFFFMLVGFSSRINAVSYNISYTSSSRFSVFCSVFVKLKGKLGIVVYACNHSTNEMEAGRPINLRLA